MDTTAHHGGLAGLFGRMFGAANGAVANVSSRFDDLLFLALKIVAIGVAGIAVHKYSGMRAGGDELAWYMYFGLGVVAIGFEYYGAQTIIDGWFDRAAGALVLGLLLCAPALAFSYSNAISSAAVQQSTAAGVQKAAFWKTEDTRKTIKNLEDQLAIKKGSVDWAKSLDAPESYDARIEAAEADATYEATRKGCKSKCIAKQQLAASLKADKQNAINRAVTLEEIKKLTADLDAAKARAEAAPVATSEVRADTAEYAAWFGTDAEHGQTMQARHVALTITLFVTFAGLLTGWKRNRGRDLKPWGIANTLYRIYRWLHRAMFGGEPGNVKIIENHTVVNRTDRAIGAALANVARNHGLVPA